MTTLVMHGVIPRHVFGDHVACLGSQLASLVASIKAVEEPLSWYACDVEATYRLTSSQFSNGDRPMPVGCSDDFEAMCLGVDQFRRGVFLAVPTRLAEPLLPDSMDTEDSDIENLRDASLEIRAFDTSYFLIATSRRSIVDLLHETFAMQSASGAR